MMKGKLVKEYEDFYLISDKEIEKGDEYVKLNNRPRTLLLGTTISHVTKVSKLSKQNCDEIFGAVDVEKLAEENTEEFIEVFDYNDGRGNICRFNNSHQVQESYIKGFNKAMELNKDKKFTEVDMIKFADAVYKLRKENQVFEGMPELLQSLQQPIEIEVEIEMDRIPADLAPGGWDVFPKLDSHGCIILKRVV
jgi:hypothetical protein